MILNENIKNYYKQRISESIVLHEAPAEPSVSSSGPPDPFGIGRTLRKYLDPIKFGRERLQNFKNWVASRQILDFNGRPVHFGSSGLLDWQVSPNQPKRFYAQDPSGKWHCYEEVSDGVYQKVKIPRDFNPTPLGLRTNPSAPTGGRNATRIVPGVLGGWIGSESGEENETGPLDTGDTYPPALAPYVAT
jgi:hypothetical protein